MMRQRSATCCGVPCAASQWRTCLRCSADRESGGLERGMSTLSTRLGYMSSYLLDTTLGYNELPELAEVNCKFTVVPRLGSLPQPPTAQGNATINDGDLR